MTERPRGPAERSLTLPSDLEELTRVRRFVTEAAGEAGFLEARVFDITVASSEAAANAIEHAPVKGEVTVKALIFEDRLEIQVLGPGEFQAPHRLANGHSHRGLGLPLMAQFSDHLALYSGPSGGTLVSLTFYRPGAEKPEAEPIPPSMQEMLEENELVSAITTNAPVGLYVLDTDLRFRWANPAYRAFLGEQWLSTDLTGMYLGDVLPEPNGRLLDRLRSAAQTGIVAQTHENASDGAGAKRAWWRRVVVPLRAGKPAPPYDLLVMVTDETEQKQNEERFLRQQARLELDKALFRGAADILEEALSDRGEAELGDVCLEVAMEATQSEIGFIGEVGPNGRLHDVALANPEWKECGPLEGHGGKRARVDLEVGGLYGAVLQRGESFFTNQPALHPDSMGPPEGHPPLNSFLGVPLKRGESTFGLIAVGNRPGGYGPEQKEMLQALAPIVVEALDRQRSEEALEAELRGTEVLRAIAAKAAETSDVRALAGYVLQVCRELLGAKTGLVHEAEGHARVLGALALTGYPEKFNRLVRELAFDDPVAPSSIAFRGDVAITHDSPILPPGMAERERLAGITTYRWIALPIHVKGEKTGVLGLTFDHRRPFTEREIDLFQTIADQLGVGIVRARAETALRESEEKYRELFKSIDQGFLIMEVVPGEEGTAADLCVVEANPAATGMLGRDLTGCRVRDLAPIFDDIWYEAFGSVAARGQSVNTRRYSQLDDRWYDLYVFGLGGTDARRIGAIFLDVTDDVRAESNLRLLADIERILSGSSPLAEMVALVGSRLGEDLGVENLLLAQADEANDRVLVLYSWREGRAASLLQAYRLSELNGQEYWQAMHGGEAFVVRDTQTDPRSDAERHREFEIGAYLVVPVDRDGRWKYQLSVDTSGPRDWTGREVALLREIASRVVARVERGRAEEELLRSRERYAFLLGFTDSMRPLTDALEIQQTAAMLLGRYLRVDRSAYAEVDGDDLLVTGQYSRHGDSPVSRVPHPGAGAPKSWMSAALREGQAIAIADVETNDQLGEDDQNRLRAAGIRALSGAVVMRGPQPVAAIACHSERPRQWLPEELELMQEVAERTWAATERVRAEAALRESEERHRALAEENERLFRQQLDIAEHLQMALLNIPSDIGRVRLGHLYRSATETAKIGGDFYDVYGVKDGNIAVLMGDVAGHGIQAARTGTLVKDVVHAFTHQSLRTHEVLRRTNLLLIEKELPSFVTLFLGILDPQTGVFRYSSAGHPESMIRRLSGDIEMLGCGSSPLGVYPDASWKPHEIELKAGEVLLLYSDGVTEARRNKELFGEQRLERLLRRKRVSVGRLPHLILDQVLAFSGGSLQDDAAVLALSLTELQSDVA